MRISDWSSDVCSSDLDRLAVDVAAKRLLVELRQQEAAVLAEPRARQRLAHDGIAGETLMARPVLAHRAERHAQAVLDPQSAALADRRIVRSHQGMSRPPGPQPGDPLD